jgi:hypothetical protein
MSSDGLKFPTADNLESETLGGKRPEKLPPLIDCFGITAASAKLKSADSPISDTQTRARPKQGGFLDLIPAFCVWRRTTGPARMSSRELTTPHPERGGKTRSKAVAERSPSTRH